MISGLVMSSHASRSANYRPGSAGWTALPRADSSGRPRADTGSAPSGSIDHHQRRTNRIDWQSTGGSSNRQHHSLHPASLRARRAGHCGQGLRQRHHWRTTGGPAGRHDRPSLLCRSHTCAYRQDHSSLLSDGFDWRMISGATRAFSNSPSALSGLPFRRSR